MSKSKRLSLKLNNYARSSQKKSLISRYLKSFLPEMIYRTMRLENEPVSRKMISSLLK